MTDKTILVVNDERLINRAMVEQLKNRGYTNILTAFDGKDALDKIKGFTPHLIISDINMPHIDGWRLCAILRESMEYHNVPIILVTATYGDLTAEQMARDVGASAFLQAPYNELELTALVNKLLTGEKSPLKEMEIIIKRRILVAEPDLQASGKLGLYLKEEGNEVMSALDGEMTLEIIKKERPDILFLSYDMSKMSGMDVLQEVRKIYHPLIVMMVTPMEYHKLKEREFLGGIDEIIKKPFQIGDMPGICERIFKKYNIRKLDEQFKEKMSQINTVRQKLHTILDSLSEMVVIADSNDRIQYGNRRFKEFIGDKPLTESCYKIIYGREERCKECQRDNVIRENKTVRFERPLPNGTHFIITQTPIQMQDGSTSCLEIISDMTDIVRMKEMLIHQEKLASVGEIVSGVAHELNNALSGVIGYSELLSESGEVVSDKGKKDIRIILKEGERCRRIVENLLTFSRKRKPEKRPININEMIEKTFELRAYHLKGNNIEVVKDLDSRIPAVMGDFSQIQQVFLNLLNNAEYAMKESHNSGRLTVRTKAIPPQSGLRIEFEDDGPGMSKEILNRIFEPFFSTKKERGTGLGLSVSLGIIQEHGGRMWAESPCLGQKGARFIIEIPFVSV